MLPVKFEWENGEKWKTNDGIEGYFRLDNGSDVWPEKIQAANTIDEVVAALKSLNCCYAGAWIRGDNLFIAADHVRSIPLYYSTDLSCVHISDNAVFLAEKLNCSLDEWDLNEFECSGFVGNGRTVFNGIAGTQSGELVVIDLRDKTVSSIKHFSCFNSFVSGGDVDELDGIMTTVFRELIDTLNGKTVLLALSGGHDSRTVAAMLKRMRYENVICYSLGHKDSKDIQVAEQVAKKLGYPFYPIYFSTDDEKKFRNSEIWRNLIPFIHHGDSYQCIVDAIAFSRLKEIKEIPSECVCLPGHTFEDAFLAVWDALDENSSLDEEAHKQFSSMKRLNGASKAQCRGRFPAWYPKNTRLAQASAFAEVGRREYYLKFYGNNMKVAEYFGFEWRMPFLDRRATTYIMQLNEEAATERRFWYQYVKKCTDPYLKDIPYANDAATDHRLSHSKRMLRRRLSRNTYNTLARFYHAFSPNSEFAPLPISIGERIYMTLIEGASHPNTYCVRDIAGYLKKKFWRNDRDAR